MTISHLSINQQHQQAKTKGQGMVEFALILPLLLVFLIGTIEFGRMLTIYSSVSSAAREAARWGSVVGLTTSGTPYYLDCVGMGQAATRTAVLTSISSATITYEKPNTSSADFDTIGKCVGTAPQKTDPITGEPTGVALEKSDMENGYRITVVVVSRFAPIMPLIPIPATDLSFTTSRSVFPSIEGAPQCNDGIDNDSDGFTDFSGGDPKCANATDQSETVFGSTTSSNCYVLSLTYTNATANNVSVSPDRSSGCNYHQYSFNTTVTLTAVNINGKSFSYWEWNGDNYTTSPFSVQMNNNQTVRAEFNSGTCYTLNTSVSGSGSLVTPFSPASNCDPDNNASTVDYLANTQVLVTASPSAGQILTKWVLNGVDQTNINPFPVTLTGATTLQAVFGAEEICNNTLSTSVQPQAATGTILISPANCAGSNKYKGQESLTALNGNGYVFSSWSVTKTSPNAAYSATSNPIYIDMDADYSVTANYVRCYSLIYLPSINGSLVVSPLSSGNCPGLSYTAGTLVTLTAVGDTGYTFNSWVNPPTGADTTSTPGVMKITVSQNMQGISATFVASNNCYLLSPSAKQTGTANNLPGAINGQFAFSPTPNCPGDSTRYQVNTDVDVSFVTTSGYTFNYWAVGANTDLSATTTVRVLADTYPYAYFTPPCYALNVTLNPNASGLAVAKTIISGTSCLLSDGVTSGYTVGSVVQLSASSGSDYRLESWAGATSSGINIAEVTVNADPTTVTANFVPTCYTLTLGVAPGNTGTVSGPNQPTTCTTDNGHAGYVGGTSVSFAADPTTTPFVKWVDSNGNDVSQQSSIASPTIEMTGDLTYLAKFGSCYTLNLIMNPSSVPTSAIARNKQPDCNSNTQYVDGEVITLTGNDSGIYKFVSFSPSNTVTMTGSDQTVTANYSLQCYTLTTVVSPNTLSNPAVPSNAGSISVAVNSQPNGAGTCTNGLSSNSNGTATYAYTVGTTLTLTQTAASGYTFSSWSGSGSGSPSRSVTMSANQSVTATFTATCPSVQSVSRSDNQFFITFVNYTSSNPLTLNEFSLTYTQSSQYIAGIWWPNASGTSTQVFVGQTSGSSQTTSGESIKSSGSDKWTSGSYRSLLSPASKQMIIQMGAAVGTNSYTFEAEFSNGCELSGVVIP